MHYVFIQNLRSIGLNLGQHIKKVIFLNNIGAKQVGLNAFITAPVWYRKVGEVWSKNSVKSAGRKSATLESYDEESGSLRVFPCIALRRAVYCLI